MDIIEHGRLHDGKLTFECPCGCKFIPNGDIGDYYIRTVEYLDHPVLFEGYKCRCPECGKSVFLDYYQDALYKK